MRRVVAQGRGPGWASGLGGEIGPLLELFMSVRELRNLMSDLQLPEFTDTSERGKRAAAREQTREKTDPNMEEANEIHYNPVKYK